MWSPGIQLQYGVYGTDIVNYTSAALVAVATAGTVIAAVAGKIIRVLALNGNMSGTGTIQFLSNAVAITGAMSSGTGTQIFLDFCPGGWFESSSGNSITATISGGFTFSGTIVYVTR